MTPSIDRGFFSAFPVSREMVDKAIGLEMCLTRLLKVLHEKEPYDERIPFGDVMKMSSAFRSSLENIEKAKTGRLTHELALEYLRVQKLPFERAIDLGWFDLVPQVVIKTASEMGGREYPELPLSNIEVLMNLLWFVRVKFYDEDFGEFGYRGFKTLCDLDPPLEMLATDLCESYQRSEIPSFESSPKLSRDPWNTAAQLHQIAKAAPWGADPEIYYTSRRAVGHPWEFPLSAKIGEELLCFFLQKIWGSLTSLGTLDPDKVSYNPKIKGYHQSLVYLIDKLGISLERLHLIWTKPHILREAEVVYSVLSPKKQAFIHQKAFAVYSRALIEMTFDRRLPALAAWVTRQKSALFKC